MVGRIKSSERTLALFEFYSREQKPLTMKEIAEGLGMPQSSTSVLVRSLADLGYLEYDRHSRTFYPTLRIPLLGTWMRRQHRRAGQLPRLLADVSNKTGETTILAMRNGIYAQYLIAHTGRSPEREKIESGMLYPLACCATGWCLLTLESKQNLEKIVRRTSVEAKGRLWRASAQSALENVAETQRNGFAHTKGETAHGLGAIAVLLPSVPGAYAMSAGSGGPVDRVQRKKELILGALQDMAAQVRTLANAEQLLPVA